MTSKQRAYLKGLAMNIDPILQIGKSSLTPEFTKSVDEALEARELIKIHVLQNCLDDSREMAQILAERTGSQVVQVIGRKIILYREGKKIGIMGGTFDPVHVGHLILGEAAYRQFSLERVWFMPSGNPPHKRDRTGGATDEQRVEMVRLAISDNPHFRLSLIEMYEDGYSYTYRTLEYLRKQYPDTEFYFIIGGDSLFEFNHWREPQRIANACHIVAAVRNQVSPEKFDTVLSDMRSRYQREFLKLDTPNLDISSRHIRDMILKGESVKYYLPDPVIQYIYENHIYGS